MGENLILQKLEGVNARFEEVGELITLPELKRNEYNRIEKQAIINYLLATSGHLSKAAELAGLDVSNFHKLVKKHGIEPGAYKKT